MKTTTEPFHLPDWLLQQTRRAGCVDAKELADLVHDLTVMRRGKCIPDIDVRQVAIEWAFAELVAAGKVARTDRGYVARAEITQRQRGLFE